MQKNEWSAWHHWTLLVGLVQCSAIDNCLFFFKFSAKIMVFPSIQRQAAWRFKTRCNFTVLLSKSACKRNVSILLCSHRFDLYLHAGAGPQGLMAGRGPGVLEIKCPFNRGRPTAAAPPKQPPWYYMPQVCHSFQTIWKLLITS